MGYSVLQNGGFSLAGRETRFTDWKTRFVGREARFTERELV